MQTLENIEITLDSILVSVITLPKKMSVYFGVIRRRRDRILYAINVHF